MTETQKTPTCPAGCTDRACGGCNAEPLSGTRYEHLNCLVATAEGEWWECDCGLPLDEPAGVPATVTCACGQEWRFDRWPVGKEGDKPETSEVEPRRV